MQCLQINVLKLGLVLLPKKFSDLKLHWKHPLPANDKRCDKDFCLNVSNPSQKNGTKSLLMKVYINNLNLNEETAKYLSLMAYC